VLEDGTDLIALVRKYDPDTTISGGVPSRHEVD
jgi:hypothetical protein